MRMAAAARLPHSSSTHLEDGPDLKLICVRQHGRQQDLATATAVHTRERMRIMTGAASPGVLATHLSPRVLVDGSVERFRHERPQLRTLRGVTD
jgi:hypothetical protein